MQSLAERGVKPSRDPSTTYSAFRCSAAHKINIYITSPAAELSAPSTGQRSPQAALGFPT